MKSDTAKRIERLLGKELPEDIHPNHLRHELIQAGYPELAKNTLTPVGFEALLTQALRRKEKEDDG